MKKFSLVAFATREAGHNKFNQNYQRTENIVRQIDKMIMKNWLLGFLGAWLWAFHATATVYYVNGNNTAPTPPYTDWSTAATNIQDAINVANSGDTVLVTNGVYGYGGIIMAGDLVNRVALTNPITVESVNGPWVTTILGAGATNGTAAVRCAWLTNGASLIGFTLQAGATRSSGDAPTLESGGGAWCASSNTLIWNCRDCVEHRLSVWRWHISGNHK